MPVKAPSWKQPGAFVPELQFTLRRLRLRLQGCGKAVRSGVPRNFPVKMLLDLSSLAWPTPFFILTSCSGSHLPASLGENSSRSCPDFSCLLCVGRGGNDTTWGSQRKNMIREATVLQPLEEKSCSSSGK